MTTQDYRKTLKDIRLELESKIYDIFVRNGKRETNNWCEVTCSTYVIVEGDEYGEYTLDRVSLDKNDNIVFEASNSYECEDFTYINLETMIDIYEDMLKFEGNLFSDDYDDDYMEEDEEEEPDTYLHGTL